jgi:hypothetical protein
MNPEKLTGATLVEPNASSRFAELDAMARLLGVSRAQCVEQIVNEYLSHHPGTEGAMAMSYDEQNRCRECGAHFAEPHELTCSITNIDPDCD